MQTNKTFNDNLKKGIITKEMLELALYSINKRAKNCRDKKNEYKGRYDKYNNYKKYEMQEQDYYQQKEFLLETLLTPVCIHCETQTKNRRIYDYESEYINHTNKGYWENCYFDRELGEEIWFVDAPSNEKIEKYYLFYRTANFSFHTPIDNPEKYSYEVVSIDSLVTYGKDINVLVSTQFCKKLIELVKQQSYTLIVA